MREGYRHLTWLRRIVAALFALAGLVLLTGRAPLHQAVLMLLAGVLVWSTPHLYTAQVLWIVQWQGDYRTIVTEDAITAANDHSTLTQRWTLFRGYRETDERFVLLQTGPDLASR
ncbi:hypothetical protein NLX86_24380 [Streptomyces sp. A3M-1-3]|uniref:hypothetical protein n=1 Tax=Streptomyces sp. A3M-1-3 TaxID=2962044 RepID=UPI0020B80E47|nr:hypothetical protein [Streptomyces sp. A3M-1-3]MCP3821113.1 hypothetical protein [Streptomyces sp. A3M-1-3]